ncbi:MULTISPECIES: hypothetical protein [Pseudomonas]|uniref:hypothetical protein n=1 Tax=Pseudomonas TaxID=286 RepID=UPI001BE8161A|nr:MULTISPECIES: hypothetical protein [Pseudomonas]MBT2339534.1 hypothetical protein [Pseudomonas fluorescens]MCD4528698.1 hypothetical protein [Pseudomonas sp. C3-2018]
MALIPVAISLVGGMMGAQNAKQEGAFNAGMLNRNAALKEQTAQETLFAGDTSADWQRVRTGQAVGTQRSVQAANGIDVNSGSAAQLQDDTAMIGELDALTIQNNAAREAYGYRIQADQDRMNAVQTVTNAGNKATGSILGGIGGAFGSFAGGMS